MANLQNAIHLPGNVQRRRTKADQFQMRDYFIENDLICAEVQHIKIGGFFHLHMRNLKYGKLSLIQHLKNHMFSLPIGVDIILGHNGMIWLTYTKTEIQQEHFEQLVEIHKQETVAISTHIRREITIVRNCIDILDQAFFPISPVTILLCYERTIYQLNVIS